MSELAFRESLMESTLDQMLQRGVAAHNQGNLQESERIYRAILQVQPKHPHANHNLGLIAVSMNRSGVALPLFKIAVEVNPNIEQFWLSYIEALIAERQFDGAKQVLKKGKKKGIAKETLEALKQKLVSVKGGGMPTQVPSSVELRELLDHYQNGLHSEAEALALAIIKRFPEHPFSWKILGAINIALGRMTDALAAGKKSVELDSGDNQAHNSLGVIFEELGRFEEAESSYRKAALLKPDDCGIYYNLGNAMRKLKKFEEATSAYRQAIAVKPDYAEAHSNLGITFQELGKFEEAESSSRQAISITSDFVDAHSNLGNALKNLGRLKEAEASYRQAIVLKPDYAEVHNNLGNLLKELGKLEESEASLRQAIALQPDFAEAHNNLGHTLQELGRLEEAKASYTQAIGVKPDSAQAHVNLGIIFAINEDYDSSLRSIERASNIDPNSNTYKLLLSVMTSRKSREEKTVAIGGSSNVGVVKGLTSNPVILNREIEAELIDYLYGMNSRELDKTGDGDARFGSGACSPDFSLFDDTGSIIKTLAKDLTRIMTEAVKSEVFVFDSFFNILSSGGGTIPHRHLNKLDRVAEFNLSEQKYSLVYYLSVGDQNCSSPGILKLYDPVEEILPCEGMITIIPSSRKHSAVYGGKTDRVMIGVNFYSL